MRGKSDNPEDRYEIEASRTIFVLKQLKSLLEKQRKLQKCKNKYQTYHKHPVAPSILFISSGE
jgi:hypothetical protein